ncbi:transmembrane protein, putative [Bodo saltans]|uniref:Transmembrane protein, putative n=1 Tax=Bodo saltans TaxID=75058 RepID=A0A0S4JLF7_BODSA|nr:transmembrane protein, putative [Bodo saltans]|eukprot:CUG90089.1 transmembrane protein, putative [Bodo saltans]
MTTSVSSSSTFTRTGGISLSPILSLHCNVWAPVPLATLLEVSSPQLPSAYVATPLPGNDWDASCPQLLVEGVSHTTTAFPVIAPPTYPIPAVRSATSVITGAVIAAGSLVGVGSQGGGVHGIQIAMLVIHVQTLCAANEGNVNHGEEASIATPDDLCCDLGTSPTQLSFDDYGGVYLGGVLGNTILVMGSTMMRFIAGKMLLRLPQLDEKDPNCVKRILRHMRSLAPPSGPVTLSWTAYMFLLCPTVSLCVALASDGTMPAYARWMGGLVLPLWLMPWAGAFFGLCWWGRRVEFAFYGEAQRKRKQQSSTRKAQKEARTTTTFFGNVHDWLLKETEELKPLRRHALQAAKQLRLFGSVFASYRAARHWAFNVEVFFAFVAGTIAGLFLLRASSALCSGSAWGWAVVAVGIAETTTAVALQAFSLRLELVCFVLVMLFTIVSEIVALVYPDESDAANALSTVAAVLQAFLMMYGALEHFHLRLRVRISLSGAFFSAGRGHALGEFHLEALPKLSPALTMTRHTQHQPLAFDGSDKTSRFRSREEALERLLKLICESQNVRPLTHE